MTSQSATARFLNKSPFGFSNVVEVTGGRLIFVTGQMALDVNGNLVGPDDFAAQVEQAFQNLEVALAAADANFGHVIKLTVLAVESFTSHMHTYGEVRDRHVDTSNPPASAVIIAPNLVVEGALIDIAAIAHVPE